MRCPHCRGEIPSESQFCGVCGQNIDVSGAAPSRVSPRGSGFGASSASLFELPVSRGARLVRSAMILGLNLLLLGGGIALTLEYLHKRDRAARASLPGATLAEEEPSLVQVLIDAGISGSGGDDKPESGGKGTAAHTSSGKQRDDANVSTTRKPNDSPSLSQRMDSGMSGRPTPKPDTGSAPTTGKNDAAQRDKTPLSPEEEAAQVRVLAAQISLVVERHQGQLARCYQSASKVTTPDKPIVGRINVRFAVQGDGRASSVRTDSNDTGSSALENCLLGLVRSWTFPATGGESLDFVWPFEFQAP